jgi:membrane protease YdiL (CAAX protease family)
MGVQQSIYLVLKAIQFGFPVVWAFVALREPLQIGQLSTRGLVLGATFSVNVVVAGWLLYDLVLSDTRAFKVAAPKIHEKIVQFGIDEPWKYALLAAFYSLVHSWLEEYYWRWFVFRQLRGLMRLWPSILLSALAFMGHHVVVLSQFFNEQLWLAWLFASAVAVGGVFWAWLYERSGSLYSTWLSHLIIDAGIFWVGYDLVQTAFSKAG